jgi:hypothetical protein
MQSSVIGKIEKAKRYACEPSRFTFDGLSATVRGDNSAHEVSLAAGEWTCNCDFFGSHRICSHTMAMERLLAGMVPSQSLPEALAS